MQLEQAFTIVRHVLDGAPVPVSVYVVDAHGEVVAAAATEGAGTHARAEAKRRAVAGELTAYDADGRAGAVGISGLPDAVAREAIAAAGLRTG